MFLTPQVLGLHDYFPAKRVLSLTVVLQHQYRLPTLHCHATVMCSKPEQHHASQSISTPCR